MGSTKGFEAGELDGVEPQGGLTEKHKDQKPLRTLRPGAGGLLPIAPRRQDALRIHACPQAAMERARRVLQFQHAGHAADAHAVGEVA